jgi:hypothetical protein
MDGCYGPEVRPTAESSRFTQLHGHQVAYFLENAAWRQILEGTITPILLEHRRSSYGDRLLRRSSRNSRYIRRS